MSASVRCSALPVRQLSGSSASVRLRTHALALDPYAVECVSDAHHGMETSYRGTPCALKLHVSGFTARCSRGWLVVTSTRGERDQAVDQHHGLPRSRQPWARYRGD